MPIDDLARPQVHARLDDGIAITLRAQAALDRAEDLVVAQCDRGHVMTAQVTNRNRFQFHKPCILKYNRCVIQASQLIDQPADVK